MAIAVAVTVALVFSILPGMGVQVVHGYQISRLTDFLHPNPNDTQGNGFQLRQSVIAVSHGGLGGTGTAATAPGTPQVGATQTSLGFLPEAPTDFVFAVVGEERGFVGAAWLICLYALLLWRGLKVITKSRSTFGSLVAAGIVSAMTLPDLHQHRHDHRARARDRHPAPVHELRRLPHDHEPARDRGAAGDPRPLPDRRRAGVRAMSKRLGAVGSATMVQKALKEVSEDAHGVGPVILCGRSAPVEQVRAALLGAKWSSTSAVESFAIRRLRPEDRDQLQRASVVVYGGEVTHTLDDETRADLEVVGRVDRPLVVVLEGVELPMDASVEATRVRGIEPDSVLAVKAGHFPPKRVLHMIAAKAAGPGRPWGRACPRCGRSWSRASSRRRRAETR